ncbi:MAG: ATP-binding domain-containing protein [Chitinophagales bacterium]
MKEKIEDIAKSIKRHRDLEISVGATNNSVGRSMTFYHNEEQQFWLINKQATVVQFQRDLNGNIIPETGFSAATTYKGDGFPVPRDSKLGGLLIQFHEGKHKYQTPKGEIEIEIFNRASYNPSIYDGEYATDILIKLAGDSKTHSFQNISKILSLQIEIDKEKEKLEHATDQEAQQLIQRIADKEAEMKSYLDKAQGFIRKYAELRYQPILDPIQESIKRSKIFDGSLIINGGPGTGKTTSLIQRIKFLISPSIEEYTTLNQSQKDILFNQKTSWIFYSPNELLALFLRNSMKMEELTADTERVKVWGSHKNELVKAYKLVDTATKRPFLIYNKSQGKSLFVNKPKNIQEIVSGLNKFYLDFQKDKLNKVSEIDVSQFKWRNTGLSIQKYLNDKKNVKNIDDLIRLFLNLNETYKAESDKIAEEYSSLIKQVAGRIQVIITKDSARATALADILNQWKNSYQDTEEDDDDDDTEIELEDFEEKEEQTAFDFERELFTKLKSLCRKQALKKFDKNTKFSKRDRELLKQIPEVEQQNEYDQIGQTAFFKKFFERIIKGVLANVLREIPMTYKKHRREQLASKNKNWDLLILDELVKKDKNSRIHSNEQALLLLFTNSVCFSLSKGFQRQFNSLNHPYLNAFKTNCKPVIGIDEATDFSIIDLLAINSFRHPQLSSVTLSGDIMQRMTNDGLTSWEDFSNVVAGTERKDLEVSYRQSPTLLSLAQSIYEKSTGNKANYKSYIEKDTAEPKPLFLVSDDEDEKLNWIAERIIEIYKAYGDSIPSIAIFLPNENQLEAFANKLGNLDTLSDVGILVKACRNGEVLGDKNTVRIFSIDKIKGLEFEAVFFHNLDELQDQSLSTDLLLKYLYVGLSRATFYLGLTVAEELNSDLNFILENFDRTGKTWKN